jgi:hypothetical protein
MMRPVSFSLAALVCVLAPQALADLPEIMACADKPDGKDRLACYDAAVVKLKTEMKDEEARRFSLFGFHLPFTGSGENEPEQKEDGPAAKVFGPKEVNEIDARLSASAKDFSGHLMLTLDNGQVWRIDEYRQVSLAKGKDTLVSVVRNDFGGYYMGINGEDNKLSVTRLK